MKTKLGFISLGCAKNLIDTEVMLGLLNEKGYEIVNDEYSAEVIVINTCSFINDAKEESINNILDAANRKIDGKCKLLVVAGCLAERYHQFIFDEIPEVDVVIGTGNSDEIVESIEEALNGKKVLKYGKINNNTKFDSIRMKTTPAYVSYLKIADGCDNNCTYCIIPKLRGAFRSRELQSIIDEAKMLTNNGTKELILVAQDTTMYGTDLLGKKSLHILLEELCKIEDLKWIRLQYMYPENIYDELINTFAANEKICNYFDIPIQHCSNVILKRMGRKSSKEKILNLIDDIRRKIPDAVIRTSLIVGFPGETPKDFKELLEFIQNVKFDRMGAFAYSKEEDTPAALLDNQIDEVIKQNRLDKVMKLQKEILKEVNSKKVGKVYNVLLEGNDKINGYYYGRTYGDSLGVDSKVYFKSTNDLVPGLFINVKVVDFEDYDLLGEII